MSDIYRRLRDRYVGPGGLKCPCCGDIKKEDKRKINKKARQSLKRELSNEVKETEINE